jgi:peptidoglycan LD-endopeptidase CwlK
MFTLGQTSLTRLHGVHSSLVAVVQRAIQLTVQDFTVFEGLRTPERQRKLVAAGASKTMDSYHLPQHDGLGHAVDLVPWIDGQPRWEWKPIFNIALAVDQAATELGVADHIVWGGVWDRNLAQIGGSAAKMEAEVHAYGVRHPGPDFIDGPHFQFRR